MTTSEPPAGPDARLAWLEARVWAVEAELARLRGGPAPPYAPARPLTRPAQPAPAGWDWSRLPVRAGAAATVVGVLLLLVLAASAGWFGPPARVLTVAGLGVALLLVAVRFARRTGRTGPGPAALAGTGTTVLLGAVVAATALYRLVPVPVGLVLCLVVAGGGIALADRWDSARFALAVLIGAEIALLVVADDPDALSLGLALVVQLGVAPTALRRAPALAPVAAGATALHGLLAQVFVPSDAVRPSEGALIAVAALGLVLGSAVAVLGGRRGTPVPAVVGLVLAPLPLLAALPGAGTGTGTAVTAAAALVTALAAVPRSAGRPVRAAAVSVAALLAATATGLALDGAALAGTLLAEALVLLALATWLRSRPAQLGGAWLAVVGGCAALGTGPGPDALLAPLPTAGAPAGASAAAALLLLTACAATAAAHRTGTPPVVHRWAWLPLVAGLYGARWLVVTATQRVLPGSGGFLTGHVLVTVGITVLAVVLLVRGLRRPATARTGLALIVAALAKLVLLDLVTLDGLARVAAFVGAGLVLLAVGTWYADRAAPGRRGTPDAARTPSSDAAGTPASGAS